MAILGGGNPVGGSFTGPAEALELVGKHAYAYSGEKSVTNSLTTLLSFQTGNFYSVIKYVPVYFTNNSEDFLYTVLMNGTSILGNTLNDQDNQPFINIELIFPPYTQVEVKVICLDSGVSRSVGCIMTGRIYRTSD